MNILIFLSTNLDTILNKYSFNSMAAVYSGESIIGDFSLVDTIYIYCIY